MISFFLYTAITFSIASFNASVVASSFLDSLTAAINLVSFVAKYSCKAVANGFTKFTGN
jgi:hypothetical protein